MVLCLCFPISSAGFSRFIIKPLREGEGLTEEAKEQMAYALVADPSAAGVAPGGRGGHQLAHVVVSVE